MNLKDFMKEQKELDGAMTHFRERTATDCMFSMKAEVIEFLEETEFTHKTWKHKEFNKNKQKEEFIDILFFILQWLEFASDDERTMCEAYFETMFETKSNVSAKYYVNELLKTQDTTLALMCWINIANSMGYTKEELKEAYLEKMRENKKRIAKEWL